MKNVFRNAALLLLLVTFSMNAQKSSLNKMGDYRIMMMTPDSLLSKEMLQTKYQIAYYFFSYTSVENGKLVYKPDNNDPNYKKLPKQYVDRIIRNIDEINNYTDSDRYLIINSFPEIKNEVLAKLASIKKKDVDESKYLLKLNDRIN